MNGKAQNISIADAAGFLKANDNYYILTHLSPDGDAMGSGFGLCFALRAMGKKANVLCSDPFPKRYEFLYGDYAPIKFTPQTIVTVDLADTTLFGRELQVYGDYVDLAIDHHISNTRYASKLLLDGNAAAACEVIYQVLKEGGMPIDKHIASCLYTGIATYSGCFKFENTTPNTHIIAAELMKYGFNFARINRKLFDIKSKARFMVEQYVINNLETYLDNKCAMIAVTVIFPAVSAFVIPRKPAFAVLSDTRVIVSDLCGDAYILRFFKEIHNILRSDVKARFGFLRIGIIWLHSYKAFI